MTSRDPELPEEQAHPRVTGNAVLACWSRLSIPVHKSDFKHAVTVSTVDRMARIRWNDMKPLVDGV
jgi:hypothetical protein